jgi:hypothetical protein
MKTDTAAAFCYINLMCNLCMHNNKACILDKITHSKCCVTLIVAPLLNEMPEEEERSR